MFIFSRFMRPVMPWERAPYPEPFIIPGPHFAGMDRAQVQVSDPARQAFAALSKEFRRGRAQDQEASGPVTAPTSLVHDAAQDRE